MNAEFHCLQTEIRDCDRTALDTLPTIRLWDEDIADFSDTAALASLMDVIVSVGTAVARVAQELTRLQGKPCATG